MSSLPLVMVRQLHLLFIQISADNPYGILRVDSSVARDIRSVRIEAVWLLTEIVLDNHNSILRIYVAVIIHIAKSISHDRQYKWITRYTY